MHLSSLRVKIWQSARKPNVQFKLNKSFEKTKEVIVTYITALLVLSTVLDWAEARRVYWSYPEHALKGDCFPFYFVN